jgi:hypothetical protein
MKAFREMMERSKAERKAEEEKRMAERKGEEERKVAERKPTEKWRQGWKPFTTKTRWTPG